MGLDMNIYKRKCVSDNWKVAHEKGEKVKRVFEETDMLYLRKANQIHNYFVEKFGSGEDNCQEIDISIDDIKELKKLCEQIISKTKLVDGYLDGGWGGTSFEPDKKIKMLVRKSKGYGFEDGGEKPAKELKVGDLFSSSMTDTGANVVREINVMDDGRITIHYGCEYVGKKMANSTLARDLLPTQAGFFFGSTEYDEYYIDDLKEYVRQADEIVEDYEREIANGVNEYDIDYYYLASW